MTESNSFFGDLRCFVKFGLYEFWLKALPEDNCVLPLLRCELEMLCKKQNIFSWVDMKKKICKHLDASNKNSELSRFVKDYQLDLAQLFIVALLGEIETSHCVNLVITELQAPDKSTHLSVHMANALIDELFGQQHSDDFVLNLSNNRLIQDTLITVSSDAPLPLCK